MFRFYGILGTIIILFTEINFYFKIEPFSSWYFPIMWFGYILVLDAIIYKIKAHSLIMSRKHQFFKSLIFSALIWWLFELINLRVGNWNYGNNTIERIFSFSGIIKATISFSTVLPAIIETFELLKTFKLFDKIKLTKHQKITYKFLTNMFIIGIIMVLLFIVWPRYFFPLVWTAFFFILDPINYLHNQPSIIGYLKSGNMKIPIALFIAGTICGFFWEFWNYYAVTKWFYSIPFVDFLRIFEMPLLGYLGYGPFAFELFAMYYFIRSLHKPKTTHSFLGLSKI